jgi:hypothetical protein
MTEAERRAAAEKAESNASTAPNKSALTQVSPPPPPSSPPGPPSSPPGPISTPPLTKLDHALEAVRRGFSVFPLVPNTKRPAIENWQNLATTDETIIRGWWSQWPEANPAITAAGHIILDIDPRNGGDKSFKQLLQLQAMADQMPPTTLVSKTQSGGFHVIFRHDGARVRNGANVLGRGIDVKSDGGYIVAPGASIEGRPYAWANDAKIADAPAWLVDRCRAKKLKTASAGKRVVEEDDVGIELAQRWIDDHAPDAGPGQTDNTAALVARTVFDYGVTRETARELLIHWAATKCIVTLMKMT